MQPQLPEPRPNADSIEYWARAAEGRLVLRRCEDCGKHHFPPRLLCPACWSDRLHWSEASGEASVYTFTVMHRAPLPEFAAHLPYVVALVDLAEGPRMMANIVGDNARGVRIGDTVRLCFEQRGEHRLPQFHRLRA
ncbi:MAG: Zn-ribbon domain-containing OB-fold protein [Betaproteobacteria bacterium]|nr:MAG: Zn-ribbon domain-containing OB-fold protein [Betaproteobacteria bacterium]